MTPRIAELCAGYTGLGMAVKSVLGGELAWTAEIDEDASKILAHRRLERNRQTKRDRDLERAA